VLLAFDTATPAVTVALYDGQQVVAERTTVDAMRHGELLAPSIAAVLEEVGRLRFFARPERVAIDTYDERFTTVIAERHVFQEPKRRRSKRRSQVDAAAATVILQSWLEANA